MSEPIPQDPEHHEVPITPAELHQTFVAGLQSDGAHYYDAYYLPVSVPQGNFTVSDYMTIYTIWDRHPRDQQVHDDALAAGHACITIQYDHNQDKPGPSSYAIVRFGDLKPNDLMYAQLLDLLSRDLPDGEELQLPAEDEMIVYQSEGIVSDVNEEPALLAVYQSVKEQLAASE